MDPSWTRRFLAAPIAMFVLSPVICVHGQEVRVVGEMRRMFTEHDIGANVEVAAINRTEHLYALGPVSGLKGEVTVVDGEVFVSRVQGKTASVSVEPEVKSVFLVYAVVPAWKSQEVPKKVVTEKNLAAFLEKCFPANARSAFLVRARAAAASYHIQNYQGEAKDLTHEAHDKAKVMYEVSDIPVELIGFFSNREEDAGTFVHHGQTTHIHLLSEDRKSMGHLESIQLLPGAKLLLPASKD